MKRFTLMMMAAMLLNIPAILLSGGPMLSGRFQGKAVDLISVFEGVGKVAAGTMTEQELGELEACACPGAGSCAGMFTANSMNCLSEALGIGLPGNGTIPAVHAARVPAGCDRADRRRSRIRTHRLLLRTGKRRRDP